MYLLIAIILLLVLAIPVSEQRGGQVFSTSVTQASKQSYPIPPPTTELLHNEIPQNLASVIIEDDGDLIATLPGRRYKDPRTMNRLQVLKYRRIGNKNRMTMRDYVDWLKLFRSDTQHLDPVDRDNLKIILRGGKLLDSDRTIGPVTESAMTQYKQKINGNEILPGNYEFGRLYSDYDFRTQAQESYSGVLDKMRPIIRKTKRDNKSHIA